MPTNYPTSLDALSNPTASDNLGTPAVLHTAQHSNANDAIEAIEAELGTLPKGSYADVKTRLNALMVKANNLSDITNAATARTNLGLVIGTDVASQAAAITNRVETLQIAVTDETSVISSGPSQVTFRMPFGLTLTGVRASLNAVSTSGLVTVDINEAGVSVLSTKLTIDANEKTSVSAATAAVISDSALADDAEITIDVDTAGTAAAGLKVLLIGTRA